MTAIRARLAPLWRLLPLVTQHRGAFWWTLAAGLLTQLGVLALGLLGAWLLTLTLRGDPTALAPLVTALLLTAALCALTSWRESYVAHDLAYRVLADLRVRVFAALRRALPPRTRPRHSGDLSAVALADVETLEWLYAHTAAQALVSVVLLVVTTWYSLVLDPWLPLAWGPALLVVVALPWCTGRQASRRGAELTAANADLHAQVVETVAGLRELTEAGALERRRAALAAGTRALGRAQRRLAAVTGVETAVADLAVAAAGIAALAIAAAGSTGDPTLAPVTLTLATVALGPLGQLSSLLRNMGPLLASAARIDAVLGAPPATTPPANPVPPAFGSLVFEHVSFRYTPGGPQVLTDVGFDARPGEVVALTGPSGGGKSTCVSLALRLWDPDAGRVTLGGVDLRDLADADLRAAITAVPQRVDLLTGTVADNILLAAPEAPPERLRSVAAAAGLLDPAAGLPLGLATPVGERGRGLSGGQRARVALARALLPEPRVLILDETLTHLDAHAEAALTAALRVRAEDRITLVVTHRPATLRAADRVWEVRAGQVRPAEPAAT
ncbi:amino acid ABC transporter ATP-binding/permease protein [Streptomyces triticirhizae]|uniref:ABC transporter ATP-binding protein n=1 Tax=Streptomyces triticirhizae TaxID=2483353 RepID=A0A3M2LV21_9ACTN|nr:ABC transporter ATP-binding protein [Streptomyces triticirhizae]RMI41311.1 ABC transporter ATP-binding protein [Streptomyces triticirhizae]